MSSDKKITGDFQNLALMVEGEEENNAMKLPMRRGGFDDDKEYIKFIKNVERLIRSAAEYREWCRYIKDVLDHSICAITEERSAEVTIEIHHHPINLFTICKGVTTSYINKEKPFCTYDIALEVMELHYKNHIGYTPLISTLHEKFHNGFLKIPMELVHGDWFHVLNHYPLEDVDVEMISAMANIKMVDVKQTWTKNNYPVAANE